jgi:hypothetical protein
LSTMISSIEVSRGDIFVGKGKRRRTENQS